MFVFAALMAMAFELREVRGAGAHATASPRRDTAG